MNDAHPLDAERCRITQHAIERYSERRQTADPIAGIRKQLRKIVAGGHVHTPSPEHSPPGDPHVLYRVGELAYVFTADHKALVTIWRTDKKHRAPAGKRYRREGGKMNRRTRRHVD